MEPNFKSMDSTQEHYNETIDLCKIYVLMMEKRKIYQEAIITQAEYHYNQEETTGNKNKGRLFQVMHPTLRVDEKRTFLLTSQSVDLERVFLAANTGEKRRVIDRLAYELLPDRHTLQGGYNGLISLLRSVNP